MMARIRFTLVVAGFYFAFAGIWAHDTVKDLKTAISVQIPFQVAEILTEVGWQYQIDIDGSLPDGSVHFFPSAPALFYQGAIVFWGENSLKRALYMIDRTPGTQAIPLSDNAAVYLHDESGKSEAIIESLFRIEQYDGPSRKLVLNIINTTGKTEVRSSDVWFIPIGDFILLCLEPGRRLLLYPLLIPPPRFIPYVYYVWVVLAIAFPLCCFGCAFWLRKRH